MKIFKIAVVGAGPAGYFTAQAFQKAQNGELTFSIDMIERLPTPWGLVRSGVAPDHPKIKIGKTSSPLVKVSKKPLLSSMRKSRRNQNTFIRKWDYIRQKVR